MKLTDAEKQILKDLSFVDKEVSFDGIHFFGSVTSLYQTVALYVFSRNVQHPAVASFREAFNKFNNDELDRSSPDYEKILMSYKENKE